MVLIVEDGTAKNDAESYISVADADTYDSKYLDDATWQAASTGAKEIALRRATQFIDKEYRGYWKGSKVTETQALSWPRYSVVDDDGWVLDSDVIPTKLKNAVVELAVKHVNGTTLTEDLDAQGYVKRVKNVVGPITDEIEYAGGVKLQKAFTLTQDLLGEFLNGGNGSGIVRVSRA